MNAKARTARQTLKARSAQTRLKASCKRRPRAISTHLIAAGIDSVTAQGMASGLRSVAKRLAVQPVAARTRRTVSGGRQQHTWTVHHYTADQIALLVSAYKPRKAEYVHAAHLLLAA